MELVAMEEKNLERREPTRTALFCDACGTYWGSLFAGRITFKRGSFTRTATGEVSGPCSACGVLKTVTPGGDTAGGGS